MISRLEEAGQYQREAHPIKKWSWLFKNKKRIVFF